MTGRQIYLGHLRTESHLLPLVNLIPIWRGQEHVGDVRSKVDLEIKFQIYYCNFQSQPWMLIHMSTRTLLLVDIASIFLSSRNSDVSSRRFASACFWIWRGDNLLQCGAHFKGSPCRTRHQSLCAPWPGGLSRWSSPLWQSSPSPGYSAHTWTTQILLLKPPYIDLSFYLNTDTKAETKTDIS